MADAIEGNDSDTEILRIFNESGDESEFEGFGPEDVVDNFELLNEIDFELSLKDQNNANDDNFGWEKKNDSPPMVAPFSRTPSLNVDLPDDPEPLDFFQFIIQT